MKRAVLSFVFVWGFAFGIEVPTHAEDGLPLPGAFSANVALTSDYIFRGISQSDEHIAIQGGPLLFVRLVRYRHAL